ncbi:MAG: type II secretion system major pseudopilin GspG [Fimbriimonas sp.]
MRNKLRLGRGFTLIELMVVILILAILAALIVPRVMGRSDQAKVAAAKSDISNLRGFVQMYKLDTGKYPTSEEGLDALVTQPSDVSGWKGPYPDKGIIPLDPWKNPYVYEYPGRDGDANSFTIMSYGADGVAGGTEADYTADIGDGETETSE